MLKDIGYIFLVSESPKLYLRSAIVSTVDTMKTRHDEKQSWMNEDWTFNSHGKIF